MSSQAIFHMCPVKTHNIEMLPAPKQDIKKTTYILYININMNSR